MKAASFFSGIGALDLALRWCGVEVAVQVEIDPESRAVLERHFPDAEQLVDVRGASLGPLDLVVGGFPCTGTSRAGKRTGLEHAESGLWREYARIVRESRPRLVLIENPSSLLYPGRGFEAVAADLLGLGYEIRWECVPASAVGAPHERDRVWLAALLEPDALDLLNLPADVPSPWGEIPAVPFGTRSTAEVRRRLRQLGLSAVPQAAVEAWRTLSGPAEVARRPGRQRGWPRAGRWYPGAGGPVECEPRHPVRRVRGLHAAPLPTPTASAYGSSGNGRGNNVATRGRPSLDALVRLPTPLASAGSRGAARRGPAAQGGPSLPEALGVRVANPEFVEWMMGLPLNWSSGARKESVQAVLRALKGGRG